ncbi:MAG: tetratricopeptide repeat protein, partial [Nitrospinota bacterium]|nr:tetratricopeptide repeat protein [Nitrospinota bacterium]
MRRPSLTFFFGLAVLCLLTPNSARAQWGAGQCLVPGLSPAAVIELCEDALTIDPTHPEVLYKIGWALSEMGAHLDAVASYREAIRNQPNHPQAHFGLGKSLEKLGRFDEALAAFRDALRLNPENAAAKKRIESLSARIENQKKEEPSRALAAEKKDRK